MSINSQGVAPTTAATLHPFDPITPHEIRLVARILEAAFPGVALRYNRIDLHEPIKNDVVPYIEAERLRQPLPPRPARLLYSYFHRQDNGACYKSLVNADSKTVVSTKAIPEGVQVPVDIDELIDIERLCMEHPAVKAEIEKLKLPPGVTVCNDPWMYGSDNPNETRRLFQCFMYMVSVDHPQNNHYSLPCKFSPVFDRRTMELVRMDYLPGGADTASTETQPWKPVETIQYAHDLLTEPLRTDLKPYIVQQPEGASFSVDGNSVYWQKWRFRVGFNNREGMVLYNLTYDNRNILYRLAVSEMTVPYGDPRAPYHRKQAFDVGDVGFGLNANQLSLGCDCLGHIKYFDGYRADSKGNPVLLKNIICMHEQDNGLQHKHTNYRSGSATVVRNRQLVLQMICTVANYEYIFAYIFDQAANVELEVRATGILSTVPFDHKTGETVRWGTNVGPGVMAPFHQHMFSLRVDPAIDGFKNTIYYEDSVPLPEDENNPYLVGYTTEQNVIQQSSSATTDIARHRVFKIRNDNVANPITYKPVAYKLMAAPSQMLLLSPKAIGYRRAEFATKPIWVTKYQDGELYAAGEFTNQSKRANGVETWVQRGDNTENTDVVLWHTFGLTHNPRIEDFPVMPMERISVMLRPDGFFTKNPALDVPQSSQSFNQSTLHSSAAPAAATPACCSGGAGVAKAKLFKRVE
ncbi:copper amine oxidase [Aspergillus taichungensis]|uniref:Amine oxidase n=1 Tax=Aspergillus taichungensis TaxID=482145 RepID=A0A2J5HHE6_9EURO|nr:copper amine oxidase [Aspergillus taichungensis]